MRIKREAPKLLSPEPPKKSRVSIVGIETAGKP